MRRSLAAHTGLAVLLWFFTAPFLHLHSADAEDHHDHEAVGQEHDAIVHFHMPDHHAAEETAELMAPDQVEKPLDSFALVHQHFQFSVPLFVAAVHVRRPKPATLLLETIAAAHTPRAHDPPVLRLTSPRAPPA